MPTLTKDEYVRKINESVPIPWDKERDADRYEMAVRSLIAVVYTYFGKYHAGLMVRRARKMGMPDYLIDSMFRASDGGYNEDYGEELIKCLERCLAKYNGDRPFSNYLFASFYKEIDRKIKREWDNCKFKGSVRESDRRIINALNGYARKVGGDINDCEVQRKFLQMLREKHGDKIKIGSKRLSELAIAANGTIVSDTVTGDDGEEICVLDMKGRVAPSEIEALDELYAFVAAVDEAYEALQERTKAIVQKLITVKFFELFGGVADVWSYVSGSAAINPELLKSLSVGVKPYPTQREIAAEFGRNEASVSTTFNRFMSDVKNILSRK